MLETNIIHESDTLIQRSKSYDARLNYVYDNTSVYYNENDADSQSNQNNNTNTNNNNNNSTNTFNPTKPAQSDKDSSQTHIIVTSFAPDPKTKNLVRTTTQTRPVSQLTVTRIIENSAQMLKAQQEISTQDYKRKINVIWPDGKNNPPLIIFSAKVLRKTCWDCKKIGEQFRMTYKFQHGEKKLVKAILDGHGFKEAHPNSSEFNIIWTGNNLKSYAFRSLQENQKVNHFPRSCELTRKDRLYKNVQRMQKEKGSKVFNMLPVTFVMPFEIDEFYNTFYREKGIWIVKPVSLSRGRGIYLISHPDQIPLEDNLVVSKYISNPMLIEGFKFDLRLYVAVTSFDPLVFYLYEEGLTRFATVKYDQNLRNIRNTCMHLTNYSLNKKNEKYVRCNDPDVEDYGNKWTMSALLRYLKAHGKDTFGLMMHIEEAIIKTLLAVESPLASAARMFVPNRNNCFELFGFDILVDEEMKPWVLEVNLSPSLDCDALLDIRVKSNMLSDLFTLSGIYCTNPNNFSSRSRLKDRLNNPKSDLRVRPHSAGLVTNNNSKTNQTNNSNSNTSNISSNINNTNNNTNTQYNSNINTNTNTNTNTNHNQNGNTIYVTASNNNQLNNISETNFKPGDPLYDGLNHTEQEILRTVVNEQARTETWIRLFPTADTWEFYSQFLENRSTSYNMMVHKKLYPRKWQQNTIKKATHSRAKILQNLHATYGDSINLYNSTESSGASLIEAIERYKKYERKITDDLKPSEETLKRLSNAPLFQLGPNQSNQNLKSSNFTVFPNGDSKVSAKNLNSSSNEEESFDNLNSSKLGLAYPPQSSYQLQNFHQTNTNSKKPLTLSAMVKKAKRKEDQYDVEFSDDENTEEDEEEFNPSAKNSLENKYDLATVLKYLQSGYYISRIQVRNAFALYLFKIHVRLVTESQNKDDTNIQQMDLVLRFIKKAAPNLSQEFKVYVPSRRLPLSEQKRMLAKQLHDFLHIYRKDTGQIRIDMTGQLEQERKRYRNKRIDEKAFQSLLYKCTEAELEEIMSVYMKNSQDSTVFLGTCKNPANSLTNETQQSPQEIISFNLTSSNSDTGTGSASKPEPSFEPSTSISLKPKSNMITSSLPTSISSIATDRSTLKSAIGFKAKTSHPKKPAINPSNDTSNLTNLKQAKRPDTGTITKLQPYTIKTVNDTSNTNSDINPTTTTTTSTANSKLNDSSAFNKKKPPPPPSITKAAATESNNHTKKPANSGDEISGMSCDSHSGFSNSSESEKDYRSRSRSHSRSLSRSTSISVHLKNSPQQKLKKKRITESKSAVSNFHLRKTSSPKANRLPNTNENSANIGLRTPKMSERSKTFSHNPSSSRKSDYEAVITNIYLNTTHKFPVNNLNHLFNNNYAKQKKNYNQNVRPLSTSVSKYSSNYNSQHVTNADKPVESISAKKFNPTLQQLASVSLNSPNTTKEPVNSSNNNNSRNNNVYVQKHTTHNQTFESNKNNTNSNWQEESSNSNNSTNYHPILLNGLKNLSLRKQERVYSATKSAFRLASTLNLNELETNQEEENSTEDLNTKLSRDTKLIDHLERQKEQTNRLLLKSKAKHNELISAIQKPELA